MANDGTETSVNLPSTVEDADRAELDAFVAYLQQRHQQKAQERNQNKAPIRPAEEHFLQCDSSIKTNMAFVQRLKVFSTQQLPSLLQDMFALNLTSYMPEVSAALVAAKLEMSDIDAALKLCTELHRNYASFAPTLYESWQQVLQIDPSKKWPDPSKMRVDLCFLAELISVGIFTKKTGMRMLHRCLVGLNMRDKRKHLYASVVLTFCQHCGNEYAGLVPTRIRKLAKKYGTTLPLSPLFSPIRQCSLRNILLVYYRSLARHLQSEHKRLQLTDNSWRNARAEIPSKKQDLKLSFETLHALTRSLADLFGVAMPLLEERIEPASCSVLQHEFLDPGRNKETKSFYLDLPDLLQYLPDDSGREENQDDEDFWDTNQYLGLLFKSSSLEEIAHGADVENDTPIILNSSDYFEKFIQNLSNCVDREMFDKAAIDFLAKLNTKNTRKRLVKALFGVQSTRPDMIPMFVRFVAIVNLRSPDVGQQLCEMLKNDLMYYPRKKDQINIEAKIKLVRYIGELVKFGIYKKQDALSCVQRLLDNVQHRNVEMACALLEVCGVYLYNSHETRKQLDTALEQMMQLKQTITLSERQVQLVDSVYYLIKQPESLKVGKKPRPIMHAYIQHLIFNELSKTNVEKIVQRMRRLNWADKETFVYTVQCLAQAYHVRYHLISSLADLLYGLMCYQKQAVERVIDTVLEDIRAGLEIHDTNLISRQVAMVKYLGELYTYYLIESDTILNTLYSIISFGVDLTLDERCTSVLDPPESLVRVKLALVLLNTCGKYFYAGVDRNSLDHFLVFLQQYYWYKKSHLQSSDETIVGVDSIVQDLNPVLMDHMYRECLACLRPNLKLFDSFEEANKAVNLLRQKLFVQNGELLRKNQNIERSNEPQQEKQTEQKTQSIPSPLDLEDHEFDVEFERVLAESDDIQTSVKHTVKNVQEPTDHFDSIESLGMVIKLDSVPFELLVRGKDKPQRTKMCAVPEDHLPVQYIHEQTRELQDEKENVTLCAQSMSKRLEKEDSCVDC